MIMPRTGSLKQIECVGDSMSFEFAEVLLKGGRGWLEDAKIMNFSIGRLLKTWWKLRYNSEEAVRLVVRILLREEREHFGQG